MIYERQGFHIRAFHLPDLVWDALCAEAKSRRASATRVLTESLCARYGIPAEMIPPPLKPGRKPRVVIQGPGAA